MIEQFVTTRYSLFEQKTLKRWTLGFDGGVACEYWTKNGGCTMCGFNIEPKHSDSSSYSLDLFQSCFDSLETSVQSENPGELFFYNGGSFLNDKEIPEKIQKYVYEKVSKHPSIKRLLIESRCEYITKRKMENALKQLDGKRLTVAIGFESQNDYVRNVVIRKGLTKKAFERKIALLCDMNIASFAYVFLKPLGFSESEALTETLSTIKYALSVGVTEIDVSCAFIQEGTKMADAYHKGEFLPPSLWTVLEIIKQIEKNALPVMIGGFDDYPPPIAIPYSCPDCSPQIYEAIEQFRQTRKLGKIPDCSCRYKWECMFKT